MEPEIIKQEIGDRKTQEQLLPFVTPEKQNQFLETTLGKTINTGLDIGIRFLLPDFIENQVIDIKNALLQNGVKAGIDKAIDSVIDLGKSTLGIITGKFDTISQVQTAVEKGGIIDTLSSSIDFATNLANKKGILTKQVTNMIKSGKNVILDNISNHIQKTMIEQIKGIELIDKYTNNWKQYYQDQDFAGMEREYQKIREKIQVVIPLENTLKKAREVENLHTLIKNKGQNFDLSTEEIQLIKRFNQ